MFGHAYFGAGYFGPPYFGPGVTTGARDLGVRRRRIPLHLFPNELRWAIDEAREVAPLLGDAERSASADSAADITRRAILDALRARAQAAQSVLDDLAALTGAQAREALSRIEIDQAAYLATRKDLDARIREAARIELLRRQDDILLQIIATIT